MGYPLRRLARLHALSLARKLTTARASLLLREHAAYEDTPRLPVEILNCARRWSVRVRSSGNLARKRRAALGALPRVKKGPRCIHAAFAPLQFQASGKEGQGSCVASSGLKKESNGAALRAAPFLCF